MASDPSMDEPQLWPPTPSPPTPSSSSTSPSSSSHHQLLLLQSIIIPTFIINNLTPPPPNFLSPPWGGWRPSVARGPSGPLCVNREGAKPSLLLSLCHLILSFPCCLSLSPLLSLSFDSLSPLFSLSPLLYLSLFLSWFSLLSLSKYMYIYLYFILYYGRVQVFLIFRGFRGFS